MMQQSLQSLKGFRDFLPAEARQRQWLVEQIKTIFEAWGYEPLETPTLEPLELFAGQIGEDEKLFYSFEDQGGRQVALRYDQTVPTCRVLGQYANQIKYPFRRYQIQAAYRAEKPQKGRYREFVQCDADIFGVASPLADAEVIALGLTIYKELGFPEARVLINDRKLLKDIPYQAITSIDKLKKIGEDGVIADMVEKGIEPADAKRYLKFVTQLEPNETIKVILKYLEDAGFDQDWYRFDPTIARSFSYSDGPIWEIEIPTFKSSVLGGERFDGLTEKITGTQIAGTGFGLGFDRTLETALALDLVPSFETPVKVLLTVMNEADLPTILKTAQELRAKNIATAIYPEPTKLGKQFKYADQKQIPFVITIGEQERAQGVVALKNMTSGEQDLVPLETALIKIS